MLLATVSPVAARQASPVTTPGAGAVLDLAAMVPAPDDLPEPGFGMLNSGTWLLDSLVPGTAAYLGLDPAELTRHLAETGFVRQYESYLGQPATPGDFEGSPAEIIRFYVAEYATATGAAAAFDVIEDERAVPTARDVPNLATIGAQSEATRDAGPWDFGGNALRQQNVDLAFRLGNLYAGVTVYDFRGSEPAIANVEALAELFLSRLQAGFGELSPGLGNRVLRVVGPDTRPLRDAYYRLDGRGVPFYGDQAENVEAFQREALEPATDVYSAQAEIPAIGQIQVRLYRFANAEVAAAARVQGWRGPLLYTPGRAFRVRWAPEVSAIGDETRAHTYTSERPMYAGGRALRGAVVYVRVGAFVLVVDLEAPNASLAVAEALAVAQAACLEAGDPCAPVPLPPGLAEPVGTPADGTPAA
jgi:hypothetical protein